MDQNKDRQGQQSQDLDRDPADGSRDVTGRGSQKERNSGGISNRDMDEQQEQADLPDDDDFSQSER
jgi:hypothetical protein